MTNVKRDSVEWSRRDRRIRVRGAGSFALPEVSGWVQVVNSWVGALTASIRAPVPRTDGATIGLGYFSNAGPGGASVFCRQRTVRRLRMGPSKFHSRGSSKFHSLGWMGVMRLDGSQTGGWEFVNSQALSHGVGCPPLTRRAGWRWVEPRSRPGPRQSALPVGGAEGRR